jgi:hypothetical protein
MQLSGQQHNKKGISMCDDSLPDTCNSSASIQRHAAHPQERFHPRNKDASVQRTVRHDARGVECDVHVSHSYDTHRRGRLSRCDPCTHPGWWALHPRHRTDRTAQGQEHKSSRRGPIGGIKQAAREACSLCTEMPAGQALPDLTSCYLHNSCYQNIADQQLCCVCC